MNVHNARYPNGAIRGQLVRKQVLLAKLRGFKELGGGDPDGTGQAIVTIRNKKLCARIQYSRIGEPMAAHIHQGRASENGPIVVGLYPPGKVRPGLLRSCVQVDPALIGRIAAVPRAYYANVHTAAYPGGAIRGQLRPGQVQ